MTPFKARFDDVFSFTHIIKYTTMFRSTIKRPFLKLQPGRPMSVFDVSVPLIRLALSTFTTDSCCFTEDSDYIFYTDC